jgi:hypothetical protein
MIVQLLGFVRKQKGIGNDVSDLAFGKFQCLMNEIKENVAFVLPDVGIGLLYPLRLRIADDHVEPAVVFWTERVVDRTYHLPDKGL